MVPLSEVKIGKSECSFKGIVVASVKYHTKKLHVLVGHVIAGMNVLIQVAYVSGDMHMMVGNSCTCL